MNGFVRETVVVSSLPSEQGNRAKLSRIFDYTSTRLVVATADSIGFSLDRTAFGSVITTPMGEVRRRNPQLGGALTFILDSV